MGRGRRRRRGRGDRDEQQSQSQSQQVPSSINKTRQRFAAPAASAQRDQDEERHSDMDDELDIDDDISIDSTEVTDNNKIVRRIKEEEEEEEEHQDTDDVDIDDSGYLSIYPQLAPVHVKHGFGLSSSSAAEKDETNIHRQGAATTAAAHLPSTSSISHSQLSFTPATARSSIDDAAHKLAAAISAIPYPTPATMTPCASILPSSSYHQLSQRRAFHVGWGIDGRVVIIRGSQVSITVVRGEEEITDKSTQHEQEQARAHMMQKMLKVHLDFTATINDTGHNDQPAAAASSASSASLFSTLTSSSLSLSASSPSSSLQTSSSSIAMLCDRYVNALTPLLNEFPLPTATSTSSFTKPAFNVASQVRHAISVFELVKVLFAPECGAASLLSFLATDTAPPSSSSLFSFSSASSASSASHSERYARLHQLRKWLQKYVRSAANYDIQRVSPTSFNAVFYLLSAYLINEATDLCLDTNHLRLATLLPSLSSLSTTFTTRMSAQVRDWQNSGLWQLIPAAEQRVYALLAGEKNLAELDWLRALAMHIFYQNEADASISQGLQSYEQAVVHSKAAPPRPPYQHQSEQSQAAIAGPSARSIVDDDDVDDDMEDTGRIAASNSCNVSKPHRDIR